MNEEVVFDEMIQAGREQVEQGRVKKLPDEEMALKVYLAMRGVFVMATARGESESLH